MRITHEPMGPWGERAQRVFRGFAMAWAYAIPGGTLAFLFVLVLMSLAGVERELTRWMLGIVVTLGLLWALSELYFYLLRTRARRSRASCVGLALNWLVAVPLVVVVALLTGLLHLPKTGGAPAGPTVTTHHTVITRTGPFGTREEYETTNRSQGEAVAAIGMAAFGVALGAGWLGLGIVPLVAGTRPTPNPPASR
jgi:hypothetical protein